MACLNPIQHSLLEASKFFEDLKDTLREDHGPIGAGMMIADGINYFAAQAFSLPEPPTPAEILTGKFITTEKAYEVVKTGLAGSGSLGIFTAFGLLVTGLPGLSLVTFILSASSFTGAYMAHQAYIQRSLTDSIADLRRTERDLAGQVSQLSNENSIYRAENAHHQRNNEEQTAQIQHLTEQNSIIRTNIENMAAQTAQLALQNEHYRTIAHDFRAFLEQFQSNASLDRQQFANRLNTFTEQLAAGQELWKQFSDDTNTFRQAYAAQLEGLRELVIQLTDPRHTLVRLEEHRQINEQIQEAVRRLEEHRQHLNQIDAQISLREGQLQERDQLLVQLRAAHQQILASYQQQNQTLGQRNETLERELDRLTSLIDHHFEPSASLTIHIDVPSGYSLGIRQAPSWNTNIRFNPEHAGWTGQIPIGKEFKFVLIPSGGELLWEKGPNRLVHTLTNSLQEVTNRPAQF